MRMTKAQKERHAESLRTQLEYIYKLDLIRRKKEKEKEKEKEDTPDPVEDEVEGVG